MQPVVTAEEMRWCDETTIRTIGIPGLVLMENAGSGVSRLIHHRFGPQRGKNIHVFCGRGNNGGDGFVIARYLHQQGATVFVFLLDSPTSLKGDSKTNFAVLQRIARKAKETLAIIRFRKSAAEKLRRPDMIVDAIFGTGFSGSAKGLFAEAIHWINSREVPTLAVDIPSGVNGTTGIAGGPAVNATLTATFGLQKTGLYCNDARDLVGELTTIDIGIPASVVEAGSFKTFLTGSADVLRLLPRRRSTVHKYSVGKVFVLAGSRGYTGAAALCAEAALRSGAGAVVLGTPDAVYPVLARKLTEAIVEPLPSTADGCLALDALEKIQNRLLWADVLVLGPGLSRNPETITLIQRIVMESRSRTLVDADALFAVAGLGVNALKRTKGEIVLTPHAGECARILRRKSKDIERDRITISRSASHLLGQTFVLKGAPTVTATPQGMVYMNSTGNPGMATVGSGDVLAGIIGSLWAQGMQRDEAAFCGVHLHGLAGDLAATSVGVRSLVARDLIDWLPRAFLAVESGEQV